MVTGFINWIIANGNVVDLILLLMGIPVAWQAMNNRKINKLNTHRFHQLDKLTLVHSWIINLKLGVKTVKTHRNGDYEIVNPIDVIDD